MAVAPGAEPISVDAKSPSVSGPGDRKHCRPAEVCGCLRAPPVPTWTAAGARWGVDRFFSGGSVLVRPVRKNSSDALDPDISRHVRLGEFRYDIPLEPGSYEMHLHFAEILLADFISAESSGEGQRVFRVSANGKPILEYFDVVADAAGANTSDERVLPEYFTGRRWSAAP